MSAGRWLVEGVAEGPVRHAEIGLSFWGGVDARTGAVIDARHPLKGQSLAGAIVAIPSGRGSCTASAVLLELIQAGRAPAALIFCEDEPILTFGVIAAQEMFGTSLPVIQLDRAAFARLAGWKRAAIGRDGISGDDGLIALSPPGGRVDPALSARDRAMLDGAEGEARRIAMRIILRLSAALGADELIDVTRAHLDCCIHTGPASVAVPEKLAGMGGRFAVPTTLNAISTDLQRWRALGLDSAISGASEKQAAAYLAMGAKPTFTCAPYLAEAPGAGEQIAWAESNAVAYANSVLGARTQKYPDYLDLCIALTGRAPFLGCHRPEGRLASTWIDVAPIRGFDDSFWPLLGYLVGLLSPHDIPAVTGLEASGPDADDLKAFAAAFATTSGAPMFHIVGVTPEAPTLDAVLKDGSERQAIGKAQLAEAWRGLNADGGGAVGLIAIGNPHSSVTEIERLADLVEGRRKATDVDIVVTTARATLAEAAEARRRLEAFGVRFVTDICWCMMDKPIAPPRQGGIVTNSGKYAHYGPSLVGGPFHFASLAGCVEAACTGWAEAGLPEWLAD
jgi:hypothetical protein